MGRLEHVIQTAIDLYYFDKENISGLLGEPLLWEGDLSLEMQQKLEKLTSSALLCSQGLTALDDIPYSAIMRQLYAQLNADNLRDVIKMLEVHRQTLEPHIGTDLASMAHAAEDRIYDLAEMALQERPSDKAAAFLKRVARCYLFGFDPECLLMCRSAMDAELLSEVSGDECISVLGQRPSFNLYDRIEVARQLHRLSFELAQEAHSIRLLGNKAVHGDPDVAKGVDVLEIIGSTLRIIRALNPEGNGKEEA